MTMSFFLRLIVITVLLLPALLLAAENQSPILDNLIAEALQNNPQLRAARQQTEVAHTQITQAKAWNAPQLGMEFYQTPIRSFPNPVKDGMETDYFLQQMLPFPGKLSAMSKAATSNAEMESQNNQALEKKVIRDLKSAFYELYFVQRQLSINHENQELINQLVENALRQYEVGMGNQLDVLRAQTEQSTLSKEEIDLEGKKRVSEAMLNMLLGRPVDSSFTEIAELEIVPLQWSLIQLQPLALANRAELSAMNASIQMNRFELTAARREYFPDLMLRVMYKDMKMTSNDYWSLMAGVDLPLALWSNRKYTARATESELKIKQNEAELQDLRNMVLFEVQEALVNLQTQQNLVQLYQNTILPQAEQTLQISIAVYQTGRSDFLMLLESYRMALMAKTDYYMAVMKVLTSQAQLEQAVGLELDQIKARIQ